MSKIRRKLEVKMECKKCLYLNELFNNLVKTGKSTNRDYWVMTELFVMLHGKDFCVQEASKSGGEE